MRTSAGIVVIAAAAVGVIVVIGNGSAQTSRQQVPTFEPDPLWSETLPNKWVTGQVGGVAVDSHDNLWVFHRPGTIPDGEKAASLNPPQAECCIPAPPVLQFDSNGKFLQAWGGPGQGYEWFTTEHGIFVDDQDNVWLSGNAKEDNQILKFTSEGSSSCRSAMPARTRAATTPRTSADRPACSSIRRPTSCSWPTATSTAASSSSTRSTGAYKRHWGAYGKTPDDSITLPRSRAAPSGAAAPQFNNPVHAVVVTNDDLGLRRRPHEQPAAGVQARRHLRQGGLHREKHAAGRRHRAPLRAVTRQGAAVSLHRRWLQQGRAHPQSPDARDCRERRWARRTQRARVLPRPQRGAIRRATCSSAKSTTDSATTATRSRVWGGQRRERHWKLSTNIRSSTDDSCRV